MQPPSHPAPLQEPRPAPSSRSWHRRQDDRAQAQTRRLARAARQMNEPWKDSSPSACGAPTEVGARRSLALCETRSVDRPRARNRRDCRRRIEVAEARCDRQALTLSGSTPILVRYRAASRSSYPIIATSALVPTFCVGMSTYPISNADPDEERRLTLLESLVDPGTIQRLSNLDVGPGWRCLEVGAGRGSIAKWLSEKVEIGRASCREGV